MQVCTCFQFIERRGNNMFEVILMSVERFLLALIVGGGIIMAVCVRPLLLQNLKQKDKQAFVNLIEGISINVWNRYNIVAFVATAIMLALDILRIIIRIKYSYWELVLETIILFLLFLKITLDKSLKKRLLEYGNSAINSSEQNKGHQLVELLSKVILLLAIILLIIPLQI